MRLQLRTICNILKYLKVTVGLLRGFNSLFDGFNHRNTILKSMSSCSLRFIAVVLKRSSVHKLQPPFKVTNLINQFSFQPNFTPEVTWGFLHPFIRDLRETHRRMAPTTFINVLLFIVVTCLVLKAWWRKTGKKF